MTSPTSSPLGQPKSQLMEQEREDKIRVDSLFWWDAVPNFGDAIGPDIVTDVLGTRLRKAAKDDRCVLLGPGSIIRYADAFQRAVIWGSGVDPHYGLPARKDHVVLALRGEKTRELLGVKCDVLGDPGVLLPELHPLSPTTSGPVGVVVHHSTTRRRLRDFLFDPYRSGHTIIDPRRDWREVVGDICKCRFVFCQSLHGAIVAYAYGVPWAWWPGFHGRLARFKWLDWFSSIGVAPETFRLSQLAKAERWAASIRPRRIDTVALRQSLRQAVTVASSS
ncbi:MAG: polysaccharide pyruvyl transferase family protein [Phycisphaerae bacterium]|nr:polysaccharide pyruvyl transferase family protein [Phycisphaerae bacterium]